VAKPREAPNGSTLRVEGYGGAVSSIFDNLILRPEVVRKIKLFTVYNLMNVLNTLFLIIFIWLFVTMIVSTVGSCKAKA